MNPLSATSQPFATGPGPTGGSLNGVGVGVLNQTTSASAVARVGATGGAPSVGTLVAPISNSIGALPGLQTDTPINLELVYKWIEDLGCSDTRENSLLELSKKRENITDLAPMLWNSFGTIAALLQEITNIYPLIYPPLMTAHQSNRVCNALALLQCVASHSETRTPFLHAQIPLYLYPFLHTSSKTRPFEYLRLTSLGVIGALVKTDEPEVINFLLTTEIIPLCLRIMENGSELSKTVATFILQKILLDDTGLNYICQTYDRFSHVALILGKMVKALAKDPSQRLLKHVIRCYLRLSDNPRAREALRSCLPDELKDLGYFHTSLKDEPNTKRWLTQLNRNINPTNSDGDVAPNI